MDYEELIKAETIIWQHRMARPPGLVNRAVQGVQHKINNAIPEKVHQIFTKAIKEVTRGVIFGAGFTTKARSFEPDIRVMEARAEERIRFYSSSAAAEGAITGFGGFLWGVADFPLWLSLKMKMLFEIAAIYGIDMSNLQERIYILHIFEITFSSQKNRNRVLKKMKEWSMTKRQLPDDINEFDWRRFQLEYRDNIDLAKLLQLIPGVGAVVGAYVNHKLTKKLGNYAMNAYRMRIMSDVGMIELE